MTHPGHDEYQGDRPKNLIMGDGPFDQSSLLMITMNTNSINTHMNPRHPMGTEKTDLNDVFMGRMGAPFDITFPP